MDRIILRDAEFYAHGGVSDAEKSVGQRYRATVELHLDLSNASRSDALEDTVSYAEVYQILVETAREQSFSLLESLAGLIADRLQERFSVPRVVVQVQKLLPPIEGVVAYAAVEITRLREIQ